MLNVAKIEELFFPILGGAQKIQKLVCFQGRDQFQSKSLIDSSDSRRYQILVEKRIKEKSLCG